MKRSVTKKPKLTKWFDGSVKPVRDGVYQREYVDSQDKPLFCNFEGGTWFAWRADANHAKKVQTKSIYQNLPWRGLAQNPEVQP